MNQFLSHLHLMTLSEQMLLTHATTCNNKYNMLVLQVTPQAIGYIGQPFRSAHPPNPPYIKVKRSYS